MDNIICRLNDIAKQINSLDPNIGKAATACYKRLQAQCMVHKRQRTKPAPENSTDQEQGETKKVNVLGKLDLSVLQQSTRPNKRENENNIRITLGYIYLVFLPKLYNIIVSSDDYTVCPSYREKKKIGYYDPLRALSNEDLYYALLLLTEDDQIYILKTIEGIDNPKLINFINNKDRDGFLANLPAKIKIRWWQIYIKLILSDKGKTFSKVLYEDSAADSVMLSMLVEFENNDYHKLTMDKIIGLTDIFIPTYKCFTNNAEYSLSDTMDNIYREVCMFVKALEQCHWLSDSQFRTLEDLKKSSSFIFGEFDVENEQVTSYSEKTSEIIKHIILVAIDRMRSEQGMQNIVAEATLNKSNAPTGIVANSKKDYEEALDKFITQNFKFEKDRDNYESYKEWFHRKVYPKLCEYLQKAKGGSSFHAFVYLFYPFCTQDGAPGGGEDGKIKKGCHLNSKYMSWKREPESFNEAVLRFYKCFSDTSIKDKFCIAEKDIEKEGFTLAKMRPAFKSRLANPFYKWIETYFINKIWLEEVKGSFYSTKGNGKQKKRTK